MGVRKNALENVHGSHYHNKRLELDGWSRHSAVSFGGRTMSSISPGTSWSLMIERCDVEIESLGENPAPVARPGKGVRFSAGPRRWPEGGVPAAQRAGLPSLHYHGWRRALCFHDDVCYHGEEPTNRHEHLPATQSCRIGTINNHLGSAGTKENSS